MTPVSFTDQEMDSLTSLAAVLPPADRGRFLESVAGKLATHPPESRGSGLLHRLASEVQRNFLRSDQVAVGGGGKYGRGAYFREGRRERRRRGSSA